MLRTKRVLCCAIFALGSTCASELEPLAEGGAVLAKYANNGNIITLGVNDAGHLDFFSTGPQTPTTPYWYGMGIVTGNPNVSPPINGVIESGGAAPETLRPRDASVKAGVSASSVPPGPVLLGLPMSRVGREVWPPAASPAPEATELLGMSSIPTTRRISTTRRLFRHWSRLRMTSTLVPASSCNRFMDHHSPPISGRTR